MNTLKTLHPEYFRLTIFQRINAKQSRNALNINGLMRCTISNPQGLNTDFPKTNNGLYHHIGKNHSKYPTK